jgi:hypothetical protein
MPLYQQIIVALPRSKAPALTELFKKYTQTLTNNGGIVRGIENHGIRPLPEKAKRYNILSALKINAIVLGLALKKILHMFIENSPRRTELGMFGKRNTSSLLSMHLHKPLCN